VCRQRVCEYMSRSTELAPGLRTMRPSADQMACAWACGVGSVEARQRQWVQTHAHQTPTRTSNLKAQAPSASPPSRTWCWTPPTPTPTAAGVPLVGRAPVLHVVQPSQLRGHLNAQQVEALQRTKHRQRHHTRYHRN